METLTPRDIAKKHRPGKPFEDELEDDIARHVIAQDRRIAELTAALVRAEASLANAAIRAECEAETLSEARMEANRVSDPRK